jgi:ribosomal protein S18 acetylase RimI-like enzyme
VGVAVCFLSFCTFEARRLINVHDLAVAPGHRRRGVGRRLLEAVEAGARELGCCRITLEVREDNAPARALYARFGMAGLEYAGRPETTLFLAKPVPVDRNRN